MCESDHFGRSSEFGQAISADLAECPSMMRALVHGLPFPFVGVC
jgi:hypothetical protein